MRLHPRPAHSPGCSNRISGARCVALALAIALLCPATRAAAEWSGRVRVLEGGESGAGIAGVAVTNGEIVVRTDREGRYRVPERPGAFVYLTCPDDYVCPRWFRRGGGDFSLEAVPSPDDFFFVQFSDAHVYDEPSDFQRFSSPPIPGWVPRFAVDYLTLRLLDRLHADKSWGEIVSGFRDAVAPYRDVSGASDLGVARAYSEVAAEGKLPHTHVAERFRDALAEIVALAPTFMICTGDLWLDANTATPEAIERWRDMYLRATEATGIPVYNTIGNNEIAGFENRDFSPADRRYGKYYFRETYGPTAYSFDRGPFHFVALDTHRPVPTEHDPKAWSFLEMEPRVRAWAEADLMAHAGRVHVILNHEPFHYDESWGFEEPQIADDDGLFEKYRVAYSLAGHTHFNGFQAGATTHITTGALSGLRWILPTSIHSRGYRLFYGKGGRLYSVWKNLGKAVVGFVSPVNAETRGRLHPGSAWPADPQGLEGRVEIVVVAVDVAAPFDAMALDLDGEPLALERWGDYFASAILDSATLSAEGGLLTLSARRKGGSPVTSTLRVRARSPLVREEDADRFVAVDPPDRLSEEGRDRDHLDLAR